MKNSTKIEKVNFNEVPLERDYADCVFEDCDFSKQRIGDVIFEDCEFRRCNFSLTKFVNTIRDSVFVECKITGADFTEMNKFTMSFRFEKCDLTYALFRGVKMRGTIFNCCNLNEASFDSADLTLSVFEKCDLSRVSFYETNLEKVNFSTAYNFIINPNVNKVKKAIFSESDLRGLLSHLDITIL